MGNRKKILMMGRMKAKEYKWDFHDDEGREEIYLWSKNRQNKQRGAKKLYHEFLVYTFNLKTIYSFLLNFNFMVLIQMGLAAISIYIFKYFDITFDIHVSLFVSPIVFPLAFSINTDFQRREKVLEDLANFKAAGMLWYFCMRDWREAAGLDEFWMNAVHRKLKSLLFHLREFLLTDKIVRRKAILRAMYEDFSDANQLIEKVRASKLPANTSIVSRAIHLLNMMALSFERLRVIREYRSPRSIRSFNKVLILFLPFILGPYFVYKSLDKNGRHTNSWSPYYISILVTFVFSALQGVQDKLDDPFDGMSEDDIDLEQIDEWTFSSLEATVNRTYKVGRFQVKATDTIKVRSQSVAHTPLEQVDSCVIKKPANSDNRASIFRRAPSFRPSRLRKQSTVSVFIPDQHPYAEVLEKCQGNTTIIRGGHTRPSQGDSSTSLQLDEPENVAVQSTPVDAEPPSSLMNLFSSPDVSPVETKITTKSISELKEEKDIPKKESKTISFDEKPEIIPFCEQDPSAPLLKTNQQLSMKQGRFKLTHAERIRSSNSSESLKDTVNLVTENGNADVFELKEKNDDDSKHDFVVVEGLPPVQTVSPSEDNVFV